MPTIQAQELSNFSQAIFVAAGTPTEIAQVVVESLIKSNLLGHDSHGIQLIPGYVTRLQKGTIVPDAQPRIERQTGAVITVDGGWGFGQPIARFGVKQAIDLARNFGIGCVTLTRSNHVARLGEYVQMMAEAGLVAMMMTGISNHEGSVAFYGGRTPIFGTNPLAWAVPVDAARPPLVLDFATSGVAYGKVMVALSKGLQLPPGLLLDKAGQPTTDPSALPEGGILLPFGGHKGAGLMLMVELLTNGLAGAADRMQADRLGNPTLIMGWSVGALAAPDEFQRYVETLLERIKNSEPAAGFDEVLLPGEPEAHTLAQRTEAGIPVPDKTWQTLLALAEKLGVSI